MFLFAGCAVRQAGLNPDPSSKSTRVLTTGLPGDYHHIQCLQSVLTGTAKHADSAKLAVDTDHPSSGAPGGAGRETERP